MTQEYENLLYDMKEAEKKRQEQRAVVRHLQEQYDRACNAWLAELCNQWDLDAQGHLRPPAPDEAGARPRRGRREAPHGRRGAGAAVLNDYGSRYAKNYIKIKFKN